MPTLSEPQREFLSLLAHLFLQNGKFARAAVLLRAVQAFAPDSRHNSLALAHALLAGGDTAGARRRLDAMPAPGRDPGAPRPATEAERRQLLYAARWLRTKALAAAGREAEARREWQAFLQDEEANAAADGDGRLLPAPSARDRTGVL